MHPITMLTQSETAFIDALVDGFRFSSRSCVNAAVAKFRPDLQPVVTVGDRFQRAVRAHEMTVVRDDGLYRNLTFKAPSTYNNHFHITTWPGYLAMTGDSGSYVFARLPDMFQFFRGSDINPGYWAEKLLAVDRHSGYHEFSQDAFRDAIKSDFEGWDFDSDEEKIAAWDELQNSDLSEDSSPESIDDAMTRAMDYKCAVSGNRFTDFWEHDLKDYTFRFLWCCHAIRWAVDQYDARAR